MVAYARDCDENRLRRHLRGLLAQSEQDELASHLDVCAACRHVLDELAADGSSWGSFREFLEGRAQDRARVGRSSRCKYTDTPAQFASDDDDHESSILNLLDPPDDSRNLGRLSSYEVLEVVGQGGMGIVVKASDPSLNRTVAIKVLGPELAFLSSARKRFEREAKAAASVAHEHVVAIHAVDSWKGIPYLVMQYVPGISLQQRIDREGPLSVIEVLRIGMQVAAGLAAAHAQGLVHRDIKPANILLENGVERVKITDFGLARACADASLSQSGVVSGTPQYMAPEQTRCEVVDPRADLFSLGSLLYAMCTGHSPFRAETTMAVLRRVCDEAPRPIRQENAEVPVWLAEILSKLLAKKPEDRFQSAAEVAALLGRCAAYVELPLDGPPPFRASRSGLRRWRVAAIGTGVVFGVAAIGMVVPSIRTRLEIHRPHAASDVIPAMPSPVSGPPPTSIGLEKMQVQPKLASGAPRTSVGLAELLRPVPLGTTEGLTTWPSAIVSSACYSPNGRILALGFGDGSVTLYEPATRRLRSIPVPCAGRIWSLAFSPDGMTLAAASGDWNPKSQVGQLQLIDVASGLRVGLPHDGSLTLTVAYSPDGTTLAWAGRNPTITLWDTKAQKTRAICRGHEGPIRSVVFHPAEPVLVSAGFDGSIRFWNTRSGEATGEPIRLQGRASNRVAISPDGRLLAVNSGRRSDDRSLEGAIPGRIEIWDWATRRELRKIQGFQFDILGISFSPEGKTLASAGGYFDSGAELGLFDVDSGQRLHVLKGHSFWIEDAVFSPDGKFLVSHGGADYYGGEIRVWDLTNSPAGGVP